MPSQRNFSFPISILLSSSRRLLDAMRDAIVGTAVTARLKEGFHTQLEAQIGLVEKGGVDQSGAIGSLGELTQAQATAFTEMERLISGARRSAGLAFPRNDARLRAEFQVGVNEPQDFESEIDRAAIIHAACETHADALAEHGWIAADTTDLGTALETLEGAGNTQTNAKGKKKGITARRNRAANELYKKCLSLQNAARLAYPSTKIGKVDGIEEARARFLLDEFPPRTGASAGENPDPNGPPTPPEPPK